MLTVTDALGRVKFIASSGTVGVPDPGANGLVVRTALNTDVARTLTAGSSKLAVTNGDGVAGNPTVDLGTLVAGDIPNLDTAKITTGAFADARLSANVPLLNANNHFTGAGDQVFDGNVKPATTQMMSWAVKTSGTVYQAACDGLVVGYFTFTNTIGTVAASVGSGYSDAANPPTTLRVTCQPYVAANTVSIPYMFPVRKGDYYQVVLSPGSGDSMSALMSWVPLGTAG